MARRPKREMMAAMKRNLLALVIVIGAAVSGAAQQVGPKTGSLVIVGGAMQDPAIVKRFIDLAGGPDAPIVIFPTAGEADEYDQYWSGLNQFRENGARNLTVMHTRDPKVADTDAFVKPLTTARGVFFGGGRQWRLADSYLKTRTQRELQGVLDRGGVIGGSSAGATMLGSFLVRGDTKGNELMIGDHTVGFGFLKNSAIDQHLLRRNRQFDLIDVIAKHPDLLGIGIDENTAIVVEEDRFDVIGRGYVAIYDAKHSARPPAKFYFLAPGDRFDLVKREASRRSEQYRPLENVGPRAKPPGSQ
jgi:cyanophycinase